MLCSVKTRIYRKGGVWHGEALIQGSGQPVKIAISKAVTDALGPEVGWFGSKMFKAATNVVTAPVRAAASVATNISHGNFSPAAMAHAALQSTGIPATLDFARTVPGLEQATRVLTQNPAWNIVATGTSFIPGVGSAVSMGMAAAAAVGRGQSSEDALLTAARSGLPGGPAVAAAFDVGVGLLHGKNVSDTFIAAAREHVPGGEYGKAAFDAAVIISKGKSLDAAALALVKSRLPASALPVLSQSLGTWKAARETAGKVAALRNLSSSVLRQADKLTRQQVATRLADAVKGALHAETVKSLGAIAFKLPRTAVTSKAASTFVTAAQLLDQAAARGHLNPSQQRAKGRAIQAIAAIGKRARAGDKDAQKLARTLQIAKRTRAKMRQVVQHVARNHRSQGLVFTPSGQLLRGALSHAHR